MPLSRPANRKLSHERIIEVKGYQRTDGLWDIEAHMTDSKPFSFANRDRGGFIHAGEYLHDMAIRITIDNNLLVHDCEASIDSSPFNHCPNIVENFKQLKGLNIAPGWSRAVQKRIGGVKGCTHLHELLKPLATVAFQTVYGGSYGARNKKLDKSNKAAPLVLLNTCHSFASDSPVVKDFWPDFYEEKTPK